MVGDITWEEPDDHSKWVLARNAYACFGDMNRMSSQWKRGGSFFCFDNPSLVTALNRALIGEDRCN
jgi:deoxyribonuclease-2